MVEHTLTDQQLAVMRALWGLEQASVSDVVSALQDEGRTLAPTSVATVLQRLAKQGWVETRKSGRNYLYLPRVHRRDAASSALARIVKAFFGGSPSALTAQLLESESLTDEELREMRRLLRKPNFPKARRTRATLRFFA